MKIDIDTVNRVAALAKLEFSDDEKQKMMQELTKIVTYCEKMNELNTDGIEPLIFMTDEVNVLREDIPQPPLSHEDALMNAPEKNSDYYKVPKFLERK
jgi:aspartyl-tRNA(Asn)/glutamyl-tRNA(Gln) amidotransferase subunit C